MFRRINKSLLGICLFLGLQPCFAQDSSVHFLMDTIKIETIVQYSINTNDFSNDFYFLPQPSDEENLWEFGHLYNEKPSGDNIKNYNRLAASLWEFERMDSAKKMFMAIINSQEPSLTTSYYNSSDIPGDNSSNPYGYGSVIWNYKHDAAKGVAKIWIVKKEWDSAQYYLNLARKDFRETYNCGTGHHRYQNELNELQFMIYEGKNNYQKIFELVFPEYNINEGNGWQLGKAIHKLFPEETIDQMLSIAENTIFFLPDTQTTDYYIGHTGGELVEWDTIAYYGAQTKVNFFGKWLELSPPQLKEGERVTKEMMVKQLNATEVIRYLRMRRKNY